MLATGKTGHLTKKVRKFSTHPDKTVFESGFCVNKTVPKPEKYLGRSWAERFGYFYNKQYHKVHLSEGTQWVPVEIICLSVYLYVCISVYMSPCLVICVYFWWSKRLAHNYMQRMRPQATGSNTLSVSIICPSVHLYIRPSVRSSVQLSTGLL